jgi:hypothetical protein
MQPGYYLTDFLDNMKKHMRQHSPADVKRMERLAKDVKSAVCFQLPTNGILLKDDEELKNTPLDVEGFTRPPYPTIALEFDFVFPSGELEHVVLIMIDQPDTFAADGRKGGVYCIPTATTDATKEWKVPTFGFLLPYTDFGTWTDSDGSGWIQNVGMSPMLPDAMQELANMNNKGDKVEDFMQEMYEDEIVFYVRGYLHLCATLGLHEVSFTDIEPHKGRNKMRRAQGKAPLYTYKVLTIGKKKPKSRRLGGTHASPRSHLRRGYYRTSQKGVRHWVQPCMVKGETEGFVHKDYRVEGVQASVEV